ncbi:MAG: branched-chain amino acid ABC transporter substrate-binding protein [Bacillaceae bacterium]
MLREIKRIAIILITLVILAGCSSTTSNKKENGLKTIKIATQTPLSGGAATLGEAIKLGVQLKIEEQQNTFEQLGYKVVLQPYDDQADPKKGVANAQILVGDKEVYGIVGHMNSGVAIPSSEIYEKNAISMVSPSNTAPEITDRRLKTVNRVVARDDFQGPAGLQFVKNKLNVKSVFIIDDKTAYGVGLTKAFEKASIANKIKVVGHESIVVGEKDFNAVVSKIAAKKPDVIYFGGMYSEAGLLLKQLRGKGIDTPFLGGDGLDSSSLVQIAGNAVKNTYYSAVSGDVTKTEEGNKFAETYKQKFNKRIEGASGYGYDAAGALLEGIKKAIKENDNKLPSKEKIRDAVRSVQDYQGIVTKVGFDEKGDNKFAKIFIYQFTETKYPGQIVEEISQ